MIVARLRSAVPCCRPGQINPLLIRVYPFVPKRASCNDWMPTMINWPIKKGGVPTNRLAVSCCRSGEILSRLSSFASLTSLHLTGAALDRSSVSRISLALEANTPHLRV
jgi:hypothetical protein